MNISLTYLYEQFVKKKIKLSGAEKINYKLMRGEKFTEDDFDDLVQFFQSVTDLHGPINFKGIRILWEIDKELLEKVLLRARKISPIISYIYYLLQKPWPEAENIIMKDDVYAANYEVWKEKYYEKQHQDDYKLNLKKKYKR